MRRSATSTTFAAVPVFPLPGLVLFPGTQLPLHVFEDRYRDMMRTCLDADDPLMVVVQLRPGFEAEYFGRPPIHAIGGLGRVRRHRRNRDGTYDVLLEAFARVSLEELPAAGRPYRRADLERLEDHVPKEGLNDQELTALLSLANRIARILQEAQPQFELAFDGEQEPGSLADHIADQLVLAPRGRQAILECLDVGARVRMVVEQLVQLHAALDAHQGSAHTLH